MSEADVPAPYAWSSATVKLDNGYLSVVVDLARPRIASLRIDPFGRGWYSANQLAVGLTPGVGNTYPGNGALTQYVDGHGALHSSTDATDAVAEVTGPAGAGAAFPTTGQLVAAGPYASLRAVRLTGIRYGAKVEDWTITLGDDEPTLDWRIGERWLAPEEITDCRTPVFWFAQRDDWGEPVHTQLLRRDLVTTDPYDNARATLVEGGSAISRAVVPEPGGWIVAKTYARFDADLRLSGSLHLQRAAVLNWWSYLGQTRLGAAGRARVPAGEVSTHRYTVRLSRRDDTGAVLDLAAPAPYGPLSRSLFATHANCAMVADPHAGLLGNEPDGYHATMVSWLQARALAFATQTGPTAPAAGWTAADLMHAQLRHIAAATTADGVITSGYAASTALDTAPSFALSLADWAVGSGDRAATEDLLPAVRRALDASLAAAARSGGLLSVSGDDDAGRPDAVQPDQVIDYWDWLRRRGSVAYPNVLLFDALQRHAGTERWLGHARRAAACDAAARDLRRLIVAELWDDRLGALAEAADGTGRSSHLYTAAQYLAILTGLLDSAQAERVLATLTARRADPRWADAVATPTNLLDAAPMMPQFPPPADAVVEFGHTMNGGSLLSWAYFEIGVLVRAGRVAEAWERLTRVLDRYAATGLLEGVNYWSARGRPDRARLEPFLGDVGLVATAIPRWFLGVAAGFDGIDLDPRLPDVVEGDWEIALRHLGEPVRIRLLGWRPGDRRLQLTGPAGLRLRLLADGVPLRREQVVVDGRSVRTDAAGYLGR